MTETFVGRAAILALIVAVYPRSASAANFGIVTPNPALQGCAFNSLQGAINAAGAGGIVWVKEGLSRSESVLITGSVHIFAGNATCSGWLPVGGVLPTLTGNNGRVMHIRDAGAVFIRQLILVGGGAEAIGGVVRVDDLTGLPNSAVDIDESVIRDGLADRGGGVYVNGGATVKFHATNVTANHAVISGGGVWVGLNSTTRLLDASVVDDNKALVAGGGVYLDPEGKLVSEDWSSIKYNDAFLHGGGIHSLLGVLDVESTIVEGNHATADGGGVYLDGGEVSFVDSQVTGNDSAGIGAGIAAVDRNGEFSAITFARTTALANWGATHGGGIAVVDTDPTTPTDLTAFDVLPEAIDNIADYGAGIALGGAVFTTTVRASLNDANIDGGGLYLWNGASVGQIPPTQTTGSTVAVEDNTAQRGAGVAMNCENSNSSMVLHMVQGNNLVTGNVATGDGGGIAIFDDGGGSCGLHILGGLLATSNNAGGSGGALAAWGNVRLDLSEFWFNENSATGNGGAIALLDNQSGQRPDLEIRNISNLGDGCDHPTGPAGQGNPAANTYCNELRDNTAAVGGALYIESATGLFEDVAILGNTATTRGSAVAIEPSLAGAADFDIQDVLVAGNGDVASPMVTFRVADGATVDLRQLTFANNQGDALEFTAAANGSLLNSVVADTDLVISPATLPGDCNAVFLVVGGTLSGTYVTGATVADFVADPNGGSFGPGSLLQNQCAAPTSVTQDLHGRERVVAPLLIDQGAIRD